MSSRRALPLVAGSRLVLILGFGGLLLLLTFASVDGVRALRQIQTANDAIREDFLLRTRLLERIRGDVYTSGTYARDYLLEPEAGKAEGHRFSLAEARRDMDSALAQYRAILGGPESLPFEGLMRDLADYWKVLDPIFQWTPEERRQKGYVFLRDEVFRRRQSMLGLADQIAAIDESQMNRGKQEVQATFLRARRWLLITIGLTIGLGLLLAYFTIRRILRLESRAERDFQEIAGARTELKQLSARLVEVQENERRAISRELHDEVGQSLTGVLVELANLSVLIRAADPQAAGKAGEIKCLVEDSIRVVRNMALLLRPSMLDDLGLVPALEWQAREVSKRCGIWVKVVAEGVSENLPEEHKTCVYRVVQEALHNIVQHAAARNAGVTVRQEHGRLRLSIEDDGRGFRPRQQRGMGLLGIQERVSHLGGTFAVDSHPGEGTALRIELPSPEPVVISASAPESIQKESA
ncbi:MAG TPA: histidine kinase [Bryobacteraceae bacterium]|nr:histidine kinase [Bryobacteraceae bacterium]